MLALPPSRFLFRLVSFDLLAVTLAVLTGVVLYGSPEYYLREGKPVTWLSFAHLLVISGLAGIVFRLRTHGCPPLRGWRDPRWIWPLVAVGFLFLAVDEVTELHERGFDRSIHRFFEWQETSLSRRLDAMILLGYGALGVMVLCAYRAELAACREVLPLVTCGMILFVLMVGMDVVTEHQDLLAALDFPFEGEGWGDRWQKWRRRMTVVEDTLKICAEAVLLGSIYTCAFIVAARRETKVP